MYGADRSMWDFMPSPTEALSTAWSYWTAPTPTPTPTRAPTAPAPNYAPNYAPTAPNYAPTYAPAPTDAPTGAGYTPSLPLYQRPWFPFAVVGAIVLIGGGLYVASQAPRAE